MGCCRALQLILVSRQPTCCACAIECIKMYADYTGKTKEQIHRDFDRNKWLFGEEAVEYGIADRVLDRAPEIAMQVRPRDEDEIK